MSIACFRGPVHNKARQSFESALPQLDRVFQYNFRRWSRSEREDAIAEARAAAWAAWLGLLRRGIDPTAVGVTGIAFNAVRNVRQGRRIGNRGTSGRGAMDIYHPGAQRRTGVRVYSLDSACDTVHEVLPDAWRSWVVVDNRCTPADQAAFRVDLESWLASLPIRKRQLAELLGEGHETGVVARLVGVSPGRVSQSRRELEASWTAFQTLPPSC
jgi:hypothetical protein